MVDKTAPKTFNEILDDYWSSRIEDQCDTRDPEADCAIADDIIQQLLEGMGLYKTSKAYKKVRWG